MLRYARGDSQGALRISGLSFRRRRMRKCKKSPLAFRSDVFARCKLDRFSSGKRIGSFYDLHVDLIKLRREDARFREQISGGLDGAVLGLVSFVLRYFASDHDDRLLVLEFWKMSKARPGSVSPSSRHRSDLNGKRYGQANRPCYGGPGAV